MSIVHLQNNILDSNALDLCVETIRRGEILCYPTETFYALGIDLWNENAVRKLFEAKDRPADKNLPLIASDLQMIEAICDTRDPRVSKLAVKFWPGPLTLVLPAKEGEKNYAIRISSSPVARQLAHALCKPLVSTSANRSGNEPAHDPKLLSPLILKEVAVLVNGGILPGGLPSTVATLVESPGRILREGAIPSAEIVSLL